MTTYHIYMRIDTLLAMNDTELTETLTGGTAQDMRNFLHDQRQKGKTFLAAGKCDNQHPDGTCAGHEDKE